MPQVGESRSQNYLSALSLRKPKCSWEHMYSYHCLPTHTQNTPQTRPSPKQNKNSIILKRHSCISVESKKFPHRKFNTHVLKIYWGITKTRVGLFTQFQPLAVWWGVCQAPMDAVPYSRLTSQVKGALWKFVCLQYD